MNRNIGQTIIVAAALAFASQVGAADKMSDKKETRPDAAFVMEAAQGGIAEVEHGKLALKNGSSAAVKEFAQRMVTDHSKSGAELAGIAKKLGIPVPAETSDEHKAEHKKLMALKGEKFDAEYAEHMVHAHQNTIALFQKQAKHGEAKELRDFAAKTLRTVEEHLKAARALKDGKGK